MGKQTVGLAPAPSLTASKPNVTAPRVSSASFESGLEAPALKQPAPLKPIAASRPFEEEETSLWATAKWDAAALQAMMAEQKGHGGRNGQNAVGTKPSSSAQGHRPTGSEHAGSAALQAHRAAASPYQSVQPSPQTTEPPQGGKRRRKAPTPPPTVSEVIHQRRARIDQKRTTRGFLLKFVVIAAIGYALFTYVFGFAAMKGEQMYPRIRDGDLMLYYRLEDGYVVSDVVTFTRDGTRHTGRIVAKAGDKVDISEVGQLLVNDNVQSEEIFYPTSPAAESGVTYPFIVPEQSLFLLCDMRGDAVDSRNYGAVGLSEVDGKVITILRRRGI